MFKNDFIASIIVNKQICRELNVDGANTVFLPFGTEYSIRLKNHRQTRAFVKISIDGVNVLGTHEALMIGVGQEFDLNGFTDNYVVKNAFKFIEKTDKIRKHRGNKIDDGIVKIEFQFEKPVPQWLPPVMPRPPFQPRKPWRYNEPWMPTRPFPYDDGIVYKSAGLVYDNIRSTNCCSHGGSVSMDSLSFNEDGITTKGSIKNEQMGSTTVNELEPTVYTIMFQLRGQTTQNKAIASPILSKKKVECNICGTVSKSHVKYCPECGTSLI